MELLKIYAITRCLGSYNELHLDKHFLIELWEALEDLWHHLKEIF